MKLKYLKTRQSETCNLIKAAGISSLFSTKVRSFSDDLCFVRKAFSKNLFPDVQRGLPVSHFLPLASYPSTGHHLRESDPISFIIYIMRMQIRSMGLFLPGVRRQLFCD